MNIKICSISDVGKERVNNEDAFSVCTNLDEQKWSINQMPNYKQLSPLGSLIVVADGIGGANAGEIASSLAVECTRNEFSHNNICNLTNSDVEPFLKSISHKVNKKILKYVQTDPDSIGLGTTIVILWIKGQKAYIAWCGDCRCYCFNPRNGLKTLTKDHSYVQELIDKGDISVQEAFNHPDGNIITRCLGDVDAQSEPEIMSYDIEAGDIFLTCSDGLCGYCRDKEIEKVLYKKYDQLDDCLNMLLNLALATGGQDNITISLCATLPDEQDEPKVSTMMKIQRCFM